MVQSKRRLTWDDYQTLLANIVANVNKKPDCIVGLTRGGLVPAVQLSHYFDVPLFVVNVSLRDNKVGSDTFDWKQLEQFSNVLVVDDINDSGSTMVLVSSYLCSAILPTRFQTATLLSKSSSMFVPHLVGEVINKEEEHQWIVFPWEKEEVC